jgi:GntR family transcriptional regulator
VFEVVGRVPIEYAPPKYALIVNTIQQRIENGTYPPGATLPSETALVAEFKVSRPTVVRALEMLRQQGWIDAHHGKGRTVRARSAISARRPPEHSHALLSAGETASVRILSAGLVPAPPRAAAVLGLVRGVIVVGRRRLVTVTGVGPVELDTAYVPVDLAADTAVADTMPLSEGLLEHLSRRKGVVFDHVVERVSARLPTAEEMRLLEVGRRDCLLTTVLAVCDRAGQPLLAVDAQFPASRHEIEDVYSL